MPKPALQTGTGASVRKTLTRETWVAAALTVLAKRGISSVKIDSLAKRFKVTRGSFYFHFSGLKDLHDALLEEWRSRNCRPFQAMAEATDLAGIELFTDVVKIWVDEKPFSPLLDLAVRDWSRTAPRLALEMMGIDELRISLLQRAFLAMNYSEDESLVRARITYFHQIGYYTLSFKEDAADRKRYQPLYGEVLLSPPVDLKTKAHITF